MSSEVRFTRAQKWDLFRISAAAVASTVFFTVPMCLARPHQASAVTGHRTTESRDLVLASVSEPAARTNSPTESAATRPLDADAISIVTSTEFAAVSTPGLQRDTLTRARVSKPAQVRARANTSGAAPPPSLSRRLGRFLAGSGKYNVRPFPTVSTSGS